MSKLIVDDIVVDKIICLHCDKRKDDIEDLKYSAEKNDFDIEWYITGGGQIYDYYDAIDEDWTGLQIMRNGEIVPLGAYPRQRSWPVTPDRQRVINVAIHHKRILQRCLDEGLENVLLLEDDVVFTKDARDILEKVQRPDDWNVLMLGGFIKSPFKVFQSYPNRYFDNDSPEFIPVKQTAGFYGIVLNRRSIEWILDFAKSEEQIKVKNPNISRYKIKHGPVDWSLTYIDKQYALMPPTIIERPNLSIINDWKKIRNLYVQADLTERIFHKDREDVIPSPRLPQRKTYKWAVGVTTAPRPEHYTLKRCIKSIQENGWEPIIFAEPESRLESFSCPIIQRPYRYGLWHNWLSMIRELLELHPDADVFLTVQDDSLFHPQARWIADNYFDIDIGVFSLYTSWYYGGLANVYHYDNLKDKDVEFEWTIREYKDKEHHTVVDRNKPNGIHKTDFVSLWGACALMFSRKVIKQMLESPIIKRWTGIPREMDKDKWLQAIKEEPWRIKNSDTVIGDFMKANNIDFYIPMPSLVEHIALQSSADIHHGGRHNGRHARQFIHTDLREIFNDTV